MHTSKHGDTTFIHNGDYSGETYIVAKDEDGDEQRVIVSYDDLQAFVGERFCKAMIEELGDADMSNDDAFVSVIKLFRG